MIDENTTLGQLEQRLREREATFERLSKRYDGVWSAELIVQRRYVIGHARTIAGAIDAALVGSTLPRVRP